MAEKPASDTEAVQNPDGTDITVSENWVNRVVVVSVSGAVDMLSAPLLSDSIRSALSKGPAGLIVDLSDVDFLASAGMSALVTAHEEVSTAAKFAVVADGPSTSRPIKLVGIADILALYSTLDEAIATLNDE